MKTYRYVGAAVVLALSAGSAGLALAQGMGHGMMGQMKMPGMKMDDKAAMPMTDGEVRKLDKANGRLTIKHGDIKNLDMPGMTMVFQVEDPALLDQVKVGDKIKFMAATVNGALFATMIDVQAPGGEVR